MENQRTVAQCMWCERSNSWLSRVHGRTLLFCLSLSHSSCCYALEVRQLVIGICLIGLPCSGVVSTYPRTHTHTHKHTYIYTVMWNLQDGCPNSWISYKLPRQEAQPGSDVRLMQGCPSFLFQRPICSYSIYWY